jgi:hypothetical protein
MAFDLFDSILSTPKLLSRSSLIEILKTVLTNFRKEKLRSQAAVLTGSASAMFKHCLNISGNTSPYG